MPTFVKGRRYLCSKCGTLFLPDESGKWKLPDKEDKGIEPTCPMCHSKEVTVSTNVVQK